MQELKRPWTYQQSKNYSEKKSNTTKGLKFGLSLKISSKKIEKTLDLQIMEKEIIAKFQKINKFTLKETHYDM